MINDAHLLPARLRAAAAAIANARAGRRGTPAVVNVLDLLPQKLLDEVVEDATAALDAAAHATPSPDKPSTLPAERRISLAAAAGGELGSQAVVLINVAGNGVVTASTYARQPGTPARAIAEWAAGLEQHAISVVPFRTVFGYGRNGVPTALSLDEMSSLSPTQQAYAERNSAGSDA